MSAESLGGSRSEDAAEHLQPAPAPSTAAGALSDSISLGLTTVSALTPASLASQPLLTVELRTSLSQATQRRSPCGLYEALLCTVVVMSSAGLLVAAVASSQRMAAPYRLRFPSVKLSSSWAPCTCMHVTVLSCWCSLTEWSTCGSKLRWRGLATVAPATSAWRLCRGAYGHSHWWCTRFCSLCSWSCEEAVLTRDMRLHGCFLCNAAHAPCSGCAGASAVSRSSSGERVVTRDSSRAACASLRLIERLKRCENDVHSFEY